MSHLGCAISISVRQEGEGIPATFEQQRFRFFLFHRSALIDVTPWPISKNREPHGE